MSANLIQNTRARTAALRKRKIDAITGKPSNSNLELKKYLIVLLKKLSPSSTNIIKRCDRVTRKCSVKSRQPGKMLFSRGQLNNTRSFNKSLDYTASEGSTRAVCLNKINSTDKERPSKTEETNRILNSRVTELPLRTRNSNRLHDCSIGIAKHPKTTKSLEKSEVNVSKFPLRTRSSNNNNNSTVTRRPGRPPKAKSSNVTAANDSEGSTAARSFIKASPLFTKHPPGIRNPKKIQTFENNSRARTRSSNKSMEPFVSEGTVDTKNDDKSVESSLIESSIATRSNNKSLDHNACEGRPVCLNKINSTDKKRLSTTEETNKNLNSHVTQLSLRTRNSNRLHDCSIGIAKVPKTNTSSEKFDTIASKCLLRTSSNGNHHSTIPKRPGRPPKPKCSNNTAATIIEGSNREGSSIKPSPLVTDHPSGIRNPKRNHFVEHNRRPGRPPKPKSSNQTIPTIIEGSNTAGSCIKASPLVTKHSLRLRIKNRKRNFFIENKKRPGRSPKPKCSNKTIPTIIEGSNTEESSVKDSYITEHASEVGNPKRIDFIENKRRRGRPPKPKGSNDTAATSIVGLKKPKRFLKTSPLVKKYSSRIRNRRFHFIENSGGPRRPPKPKDSNKTAATNIEAIEGSITEKCSMNASPLIKENSSEIRNHFIENKRRRGRPPKSKSSDNTAAMVIEGSKTAGGCIKSSPLFTEHTSEVITPKEIDTIENKRRPGRPPKPKSSNEGIEAIVSEGTVNTKNYDKKVERSLLDANLRKRPPRTPLSTKSNHSASKQSLTITTRSGSRFGIGFRKRSLSNKLSSTVEKVYTPARIRKGNYNIQKRFPKTPLSNKSVYSAVKKTPAGNRRSNSDVISPKRPPKTPTSNRSVVYPVVRKSPAGIESPNLDIISSKRPRRTPLSNKSVYSVVRKSPSGTRSNLDIISPKRLRRTPLSNKSVYSIGKKTPTGFGSSNLDIISPKRARRTPLSNKSVYSVVRKSSGIGRSNLDITSRTRLSNKSVHSVVKKTPAGIRRSNLNISPKRPRRTPMAKKSVYSVVKRTPGITRSNLDTIPPKRPPRTPKSDKSLDVVPSKRSRCEELNLSIQSVREPRIVTFESVCGNGVDSGSDHLEAKEPVTWLEDFIDAPPALNTFTEVNSEFPSSSTTDCLDIGIPSDEDNEVDAILSGSEASDNAQKLESSPMNQLESSQSSSSSLTLLKDLGHYDPIPKKRYSRKLMASSIKRLNSHILRATESPQEQDFITPMQRIRRRKRSTVGPVPPSEIYGSFYATDGQIQSTGVMESSVSNHNSSETADDKTNTEDPDATELVSGNHSKSL